MQEQKTKNFKVNKGAATGDTSVEDTRREALNGESINEENSSQDDSEDLVTPQPRKNYKAIYNVPTSRSEREINEIHKLYSYQKEAPKRKNNSVKYCEVCNLAFCDERFLTMHMEELHQNYIYMKYLDSVRADQKSSMANSELTLADHQSKMANDKSNMADKQSKMTDHQSNVADEQSNLSNQESRTAHHQSKMTDQLPVIEDQETKIPDDETNVTNQESNKKTDNSVPTEKEFDTWNRQFKNYLEIRANIVDDVNMQETEKADDNLKMSNNELEILEYESVSVSQRKDLKIHMESCFSKNTENSSNKTKPYKCPTCEKLFSYRKSLKLHMNKFHPENVITPKNVIENTTMKIECDLCPDEFSSYFAFDNHNLEVHNRKPSCPICKKIVSRSDTLKKHMEVQHASNKPYKCGDCGEEFTAKRPLMIHQNLVHELNLNVENLTVKRFDCQACKIKFSSLEKLDAHNWEVHKKKLSCNICNQQILRRGTLIEHIKAHSSVRSFKCASCDETFVTKTDLRKHINKIHSEDVTIPKKVIENTTMDKKMIECDLCQEKYSTYPAFDKHNLDVHNRKPFCPICKKTVSLRRDMKKHIEVQHANNKPFKCGDCGEEFTAKRPLMIHQNLVHELNLNVENLTVKRFDCQTCQIKFPSLEKLDAHNWEVHKKKLSCNICNKQILNRGRLVAHMKAHPSVRSFKCARCDETFVTKTDLRKHLNKIHSEDVTIPKKVIENTTMDKKMIECDLCQEKYSTYPAFDKHNLDVHNRKPFCPICKKTVSLRRDMKKHIDVQHANNKPFKCGDCGEAFNAKQKLMIHQNLVHELSLNVENLTVKRFDCQTCKIMFPSLEKLDAHNWEVHKKKLSCNICNKQFLNRGKLVRHMKTHSRVRPFKCERCDKTFIENAVLRRHMKNRHPGETKMADEKTKIADQQLTMAEEQ